MKEEKGEVSKLNLGAYAQQLIYPVQNPSVH